LIWSSNQILMQLLLWNLLSKICSYSYCQGSKFDSNVQTQSKTNNDKINSKAYVDNPRLSTVNDPHIEGKNSLQVTVCPFDYQDNGVFQSEQHLGVLYNIH
jgi:hypothetical protein